MFLDKIKLIVEFLNVFYNLSTYTILYKNVLCDGVN